jgi:hypothetical protein
MPKTLGLVVLVVALGLALPALAGDIVDMPTGNMVAPRHFEFNYIYWDVDFGPAPAPQFVSIYEAFVGVTDWLELDAIVSDVDNDKTYVWANAYMRLVPEKPNTPSLIVGLTNVSGADVPGGLSDDPSPFILAAYNIHTPAGAPSLNDPLLRLHVALGGGYHMARPFGGLQMMVTPHLGFGIFSYQGQGAYMAALRPIPQLELRAGFKNNDPFYSAGWFMNW